MASGYEMKANPAPPFTTLPISELPVSRARLPRIPKVMQPAIMDEQESMVVIITMSLWGVAVSNLIARINLLA